MCDSFSKKISSGSLDLFKDILILGPEFIRVVQWSGAICVILEEGMGSLV